jgi:hypothetical protein
MTKREESVPEQRPDGWERFEKAVDAAVQHGRPKRKRKSKVNGPAQENPA